MVDTTFRPRPQFGLLLRLMPREVMRNDKEVAVSDAHIAKINAFTNQVRESLNVTKKLDFSVYNHTTDVPGESLLYINKTNSEAWALWAVSEHLDSDSKKQFYTGLRQKAIDVWI